MLLLKRDHRIVYANPAAENLFAQSRRQLVGARVSDVLRDADRLIPALSLRSPSCQLHRTGTRTSPREQGCWCQRRIPTTGQLHRKLLESVGIDEPQLIVEFRHIDQQLKIAREAKIAEQNQANRELVRNLAHEIKNPLGGIRGAAQLLEGELNEPRLVEYTQVIIAEADRLQNLVNRLLTPHKLPRYMRTDIHVLLDRVLQLLKNEFGATHRIEPDFDVSLPEVQCDAEQITRCCSTSPAMPASQRQP